jgi:rubrerythrin
MEKNTHMGMNRTGIQMSPIDSSAMQNIDPEIAAGNAEDGTAFDNLRSAYITDSDEGFGSVPVPGNIKGMITTGVSVMTGNDPRLLLDKLGERLAFERTGTRLYDALLVKCETDPSTMVSSMSIDAVLQIRDDEMNHFRQVAAAIESLGGDPTAQTPCADLAGVEAMGLLQVLGDPRTTLTQALHAILTAELTDNVGWEMLVTLAETQGQKDMADEFRVALQEEREHLHIVHQWLTEATLGKAALDAAQSNSMIMPPASA